MKYLHTMVRVTDIEDSLRFYCEGLGLEEVRRTDNEKGRFTLVFLAPPGQPDAQHAERFHSRPRTADRAFANARAPPPIAFDRDRTGTDLRASAMSWISSPTASGRARKCDRAR